MTKHGTPGSLDGSASPDRLIADLWFADRAASGAAMGSPEGQGSAGDVGSFASGGATMLVTEID